MAVPMRGCAGLGILAILGSCIIVADSLLFSFMLDLIARAWQSTTASLGTTTLAVLLTIGVFVAVLLLKLRRHRLGDMRTRLKENITDSLVLTVIAWALLVSYHLFHKVPNEIRLEADGQHPAIYNVIVLSDLPPEAFVKFVPFSQIPSVDQARLEITSIILDSSNSQRPQFRFYYANHGKLPAENVTKFVRYYAFQEDLAEHEVLKTQNQVMVETKPTNVTESEVLSQLYPNDGKRHYFESPGDPDLYHWLAMRLPHVLNNRLYLHVFIGMKYRDRTMPEGVIGFTESCFYYLGNFSERHNCGRTRSILMQIPE